MFDSFWSDKAANREPCGAVGLVALHDGIAPGHRHVVDNPLVHVALVDAFTEEFQMSLGSLVAFLVCLCAQLFAI